MADWQAVGREDMLAMGEMRGLSVSGKRLLLVRLDDGYHAYQERCPHLKAHLARGRLEEGAIVCPWHGSRFDARTGKNLRWVPAWPSALVSLSKWIRPAQGLQSYPLKVEDGRIWVDVESIP
ncbi:MAG: Rieske 2Fe-2S domain-containing protein, partial [Chloroflexi bacterium]|nr:Rieske 2Fe-2S domain-containing protein [Chloroflexota bacterium]